MDPEHCFPTLHRATHFKNRSLNINADQPITQILGLLQKELILRQMESGEKAPQHPDRGLEQVDVLVDV
jgi:hypothetical protein